MGIQGREIAVYDGLRFMAWAWVPDTVTVYRVSRLRGFPLIRPIEVLEAPIHRLGGRYEARFPAGTFPDPPTG